MQPVADPKIHWIGCDQTGFHSPVIWMKNGERHTCCQSQIDPVSFALQIRLNFEVNDKKMFDKAVYKVMPGLTAHTGCCSRIRPCMRKNNRCNTKLKYLSGPLLFPSPLPFILQFLCLALWLRHLYNSRREGEIETKWDILNVNTLMGIQIQTEQYSRRQCTAEQTNQSE